MLWFLCLLPVAFASPSQHIIGGTEVSDPARHHWQGSLQFNGGHTCGCVMLSPDYVLTAAHCTDGRDGVPERFTMTFNTVEWATGGDEYEASVITPHPDYDDGSGGFVPHDVCVITPAVSPMDGTGVRLDETESESDCWISGWGVDTTGAGGSVTDVLNEADMEIMPDAECAAQWPNDFRSDVHICITSPGEDKGSCNGDSGGPLVCNHETAPELRGVTSWGVVGCFPTSPSVYARIYNSDSTGVNLKPWICDNAGNPAGC